MKTVISSLILGVALTMCAPQPAGASDVAFTLPVASYHACRDCGFNELNPGAGIEVDMHGSGRHRTYWGAGAYRNSHNDTTKYVSAGYEYKAMRYLHVGAEGGRLWGYDETDVMAAPSVRVGNDRVSVKALVVPGVVAGFQVRIGL